MSSQQSTYLPPPSHVYQPAGAVTFASLPTLPSHIDQQWKHYTSNISGEYVSKFSLVGSAFIIIGILNVGMEFGLINNGFFEWVHSSFPSERQTFFARFGVGFANGGVLFLLGILTLILCRQQVFALTTLFVLIFFQLFATIGVFVFYFLIVFVLSSSWLSCSGTSWDYSTCPLGTIKTIFIVNLVHVFITFCLVIMTLVMISHARQPRSSLTLAPQVVYSNQMGPMPVSFDNPCHLIANQSSTA